MKNGIGLEAKVTWFFSVLVIMFFITMGVIYAGTPTMEFPSRWGIIQNNGRFLVQEGKLEKILKELVVEGVQDAQFVEKRIGVLYNDGRLFVKNGSLAAPWVFETNKAKKFQIEGQRIGVLTTENTLKVKSDKVGTAWVNLASKVKDFKMSDERIAVLYEDNSLYIKEGNFEEEWQEVSFDVKDFQIEGDRIGVMTLDGKLLFVEGRVDEKWVVEFSGVSAFKMDSNRVGILFNDEKLGIIEGELSSQFSDTYSGVKTFDLEGMRCAVLMGDNRLLVKDGKNQEWKQVGKNIRDFKMDRKRICVLTDTGTVLAMDGDLNETWITITEKAKKIILLKINIPGIIRERTTKYDIILEDALKKQMKQGPQTYREGWVVATSSEVIQYMKPENYYLGVYRYQFVDLSWVANIGKKEMADFLLNKGILSGKEDVFIEAAKKYSVSEAYLAAHAALETGNGTSELAMGVVVNNVTVYNMFGIGAYDNDAVKLGSQYAYDMGWTTPEKSIDEGAKWISTWYINNAVNRQNTLYKMRWNPANSGEHQYATDVGWAVKQTRSIKRMYDNFPNSSLKFEIPVYR